MDIDFDKAAANPWLASAIGSALSLKFMPGLTWAERAVNAAITYGCGVVLGGALVDHIGDLSGKSAAGVVLLTAAFCLVAFQIAMDTLKRTEFGNIVNDWIRKRLGLEKGE